MRTPSNEVKLLSLWIFLYPIFHLIQAMTQYMVVTTEPIPLSMGELLHLWGGGFILYWVLAYGVLRLNWKIRLAVIVIAVAGIAGPLLGIIITPWIDIDLFLKVLKMHGANVVIWKPLGLFLKTVVPSMLYSVFIIYKLTRPRIKEQFKRVSGSKSNP